MRDVIVFDSVAFWDMAGECRLEIPGSRSICDVAMVPLPGDRVCFSKDDEQYSVVYREFKFRNGTCFVTVNVQPVGRDDK